MQKTRYNSDGELLAPNQKTGRYQYLIQYTPDGKLAQPEFTRGYYHRYKFSRPTKHELVFALEMWDKITADVRFYSLLKIDIRPGGRGWEADIIYVVE